jgi:Domain of unknown function (DUF4136)
MNKLWLLALVLCGLLTSAGFAQDVRYNFDREVDFSKFKTYKWIDNKPPANLDELKDKQIRASIENELAKKGLTKTDADNADLRIGYQVGLGHEKQFTSYNSGWGAGPGWRGWGGTGITTGQTSTITTGQLVLDMFDASKHNLVWKGAVSKTIDPNAKPDKAQKNLDKAMAKLLKNYPPPEKKK